MPRMYVTLDPDQMDGLILAVVVAGLLAAHAGLPARGSPLGDSEDLAKGALKMCRKIREAYKESNSRCALYQSWED